ncbi:MAG TPA: hypothetical protein ENI23_14250 [bacterium]|nr:hypothetical protein [bacterium]
MSELNGVKNLKGKDWNGVALDTDWPLLSKQDLEYVSGFLLEMSDYEKEEWSRALFIRAGNTLRKLSEYHA